MGHYDDFQEKHASEQREFLQKLSKPVKPNLCREKIVKMLAEVMVDVLQVFDFGAIKHPDSGDTPNFLEKDGNKCSKHDRGSSVLRHSARTFMHPEALDEESGLSELLHLISSASIIYIREKRKIIHPNDIEGV